MRREQISRADSLPALIRMEPVRVGPAQVALWRGSNWSRGPFPFWPLAPRLPMDGHEPPPAPSEGAMSLKEFPLTQRDGAVR